MTFQIRYKDSNLFIFACIFKNDENHHSEPTYNKAPWGTESDYCNIFVIHTLVVHPDFLKAGVGKKLISFACKLGKEQLYENSVSIISTRLNLGLGDYGLHRFRLYEKIL